MLNVRPARALRRLFLLLSGLMTRPQGLRDTLLPFVSQCLRKSYRALQTVLIRPVVFRVGVQAGAG